METFNKEVPPAPPPVAPPQTTNVKPAKKDLIVLFKSLPMVTKLLIGFAGILILLVFILVLFLPKRPAPTISLPSPIPSAAALASPVEEGTSAFAQTPEFKHFEEALTNLRNETNTVDLNEALLAFPFLDMRATFSN